jgi:hypothetical protein
MKTKERLASALDEAGAPIGMVKAANAGEYDDYESESATPISDLVRDCLRHGLKGIANRAMDGEFDGTKEESQAWFESEGNGLLREG